jgi:hypothetical protein
MGPLLQKTIPPFILRNLKRGRSVPSVTALPICKPQHCRRPSGSKPEIQHNRRGRGVPTLTWEEVTIREGKRSCCRCSKKEIMSLGFYLKVIYGLRTRSHANRVGFYTIPYIQVHILVFALLKSESINFWRWKESLHVLDHLVRDGRWMAGGWPLDGKYLYLLSVWLNIIALIPIRQYFSMIWFLAVGWIIESVNLLDEVVNLWIFTLSHV